MDLRNTLLNLVVDLSNGVVLTAAKSASSARAVSKGIDNTNVVTLPNILPWRKKEYDIYDFRKDDLVWAVGGKIDLMPSHLKTKEVYAKKELATLREIYLHALEVFFQMYLTRTIDNYDQGLDGYITNELEQCNPLADYYTYAIQEYARITGVHPSTAYNEFKLRYETQSLARIRNFALYTKWVDIMNECVDKEQLQKALKDANAEIWNKATI
jgi:hypothetical protein